MLLKRSQNCALPLQNAALKPLENSSNSNFSLQMANINES